MTKEIFLNQLKVLQDSTRLSIIQMLAKTDSMCACKILEELDITQGTLSHHMKLLTASNIVTCQKSGKWCHYRLNKTSIKEIIEFLYSLCSK